MTAARGERRVGAAATPPGPSARGAAELDDGSVPRAQRRRSETDERIIAAVLAVIREGGLQAVTIEAVTARSGIAKTTIYRRFKDRYELLAGVLDQLTPIHDYHNAGITRPAMVSMLADIQATFEDQFGLQAVGQLLASDEDAAQDWRDRVVAPRLAAMRRLFADGVAEGVLAPDVDYDTVVEMVIGGMVICDARRGDVPDDWAETVMSILWPVISQRGATAKER